MSKIDSRGHGPVAPAAQQDTSESAGKTVSKKYLNKAESGAGPERKSLSSRTISADRPAQVFGRGTLVQITDAFEQGNVDGVRRALDTTVSDLDQLSRLLSYLPKEDVKIMTQPFTDKACELIVDDVVTKLVDPNGTAREQFNWIGEYLTALDSDDNPVRAVAQIRSGEFFGRHSLGNSKTDVVLRVERESFQVLHSKMKVLAKKLNDGRLTEDDSRVIREKINQVNIELSELETTASTR